MGENEPSALEAAVHRVIPLGSQHRRLSSQRPTARLPRQHRIVPTSSRRRPCPVGRARCTSEQSRRRNYRRCPDIGPTPIRCARQNPYRARAALGMEHSVSMVDPTPQRGRHAQPVLGTPLHRDARGHRCAGSWVDPKGSHHWRSSGPILLAELTSKWPTPVAGDRKRAISGRPSRAGELLGTGPMVQHSDVCQTNRLTRRSTNPTSNMATPILTNHRATLRSPRSLPTLHMGPPTSRNTPRIQKNSAVLNNRRPPNPSRRLPQLHATLTEPA